MTLDLVELEKSFPSISFKRLINKITESVKALAEHKLCFVQGSLRFHFENFC